tara:strand:- start:3136 stop:3432 length:297 start_codon:yes stop_codon:yes gene_type:complete
MDGFTAESIFNQFIGYTYDDIIILPGYVSNVISKGSVKEYIPHINQSIKHGIQYIGASNIDELHQMTYKNTLRFEIRSIQSQKEGNIHDLYAYEKSYI